MRTCLHVLKRFVSGLVLSEGKKKKKLTILMPVITENKQASSLIFDTCPNTHTFVMSVYCSEFSCELPFALDVLHDRLDHL